MKTPEEMAEEYIRYENEAAYWTKHAFLAGYKAAKDEYKVAIDTYNDVAKQMLEEAVRIMSPKDQLADADKVMNSPDKPDGWISVKDRLPEEDEKVKILINYFFEGTEVREVAKAAFRNGLWLGDKVYITHPLVSHWMPLHEPPEEA